MNFLNKNHLKPNNIFSPNELKSLSILTEYNEKFNNYYNNLNKTPKQEQIIIDITPQKYIIPNPNGNFKTYTLQHNSVLSYNSIVNKFYFINISLIHQNIINDTFKKSIQKIITKPQILAHIDAINDAISNNLPYVCIVEDSVLSDDIFRVFEKSDTSFINNSILILIPDNKNSQQHGKFQQFDKNKLTKFGYCINQKIYGIYLKYLTQYKNIIEAIQHLYE